METFHVRHTNSSTACVALYHFHIPCVALISGGEVEVKACGVTATCGGF